MRFRGRRWPWCILVLVLAVGSFWIYVAATRSAVNNRNFLKLKSFMSRAEVEAILGGPSTTTRRAEELLIRGPDGVKAVDPKDGFHPIPGMMHEYSELWMTGSDNWGDVSKGAFEFARAKGDMDQITDVAIWDGPEARIVVSFDDSAEVMGARFQSRVTLRYKLQQSAPWLPLP
jgi:hypothetical protein